MTKDSFRAFALNQSQAAIATSVAQGSRNPPMVTLIGVSGGLVVCGRSALQALREAVNFALNESETTEVQP